MSARKDNLLSTTTQATPLQLVLGRDAIINTKFIADWDYIRQCKQNIIHTKANPNRKGKSKTKSHTSFTFEQPAAYAS